MLRAVSLAALAAATLVLAPAARAEEPNDGAVDPAKAAAFDQRLFGKVSGDGTGSACFVRRYDSTHLAHHPQQKVTEMRVLVSREKAPEDAGNDYSFHLGLKYRARKSLYVSMGSCGHSLTEDGSGEVKFGCGVDCDGGGFAVALAKDGQSVTISIERLRIWQKGKADSDATPDFEAGADDKSFRLERAELKQCDGLIEKQEVASLPPN